MVPIAVSMRPKKRIVVEGAAAVITVPSVQPMDMMIRIATRFHRSTQMPIGIEKSTRGIAAETPWTMARSVSDRPISALADSAMMPKLCIMVKPTSIARLTSSSDPIELFSPSVGSLVTTGCAANSIRSLSV